MKIKVKYIGVDENVFSPIIKSCYIDGSKAGTLRSGKKATWMLHLRNTLYNKSGLHICGIWFSNILTKLNINQIAMYGLGAAPLAGGLLSVHPTPLNVAFVRDAPKKYGQAKSFEGDLSISDKILVVDDILNSGHSAMKVIDALLKMGVSRDNIHVAVLARFTWGNAERKLTRNGLTNKIISAMEISRNNSRK